jgi:flagellar hook-length control protein FliK
MEDLQNDLNDKVNQSIQDALSGLTQKEISQVIEDPDQMEKIRVTLLNDLDKNVANITEANFRKRQYVIDQMTNIVNQTKTKEANKQKINQDMSAIQGYYVD